MSGVYKVCVAVSGGVDSAVSASLIKQQGHDTFGLFMITHDASGQAMEDAGKVCDSIGIPLHVLDLRKDFERIISYFCQEYSRGRTPNPCVLCNRVIKFGLLWDYARTNGADFIATGHYARIIKNTDGRSGVALYQASNIAKDQSYVLGMVKKEVFEHVMLPMGDYDKTQTRLLAKQIGLEVSQKPDSQEICFIPDNNYAALLEAGCPGIAKPGEIIDTSGKVLGKHEGIYNYTIGQRRGLGIALGCPAYVVKIDATTNTVTLGPKEMLLGRGLAASGVNWLTEETGTDFPALIRIRYNHQGQMGRVYIGNDRQRVIVRFDQPVSAITAGQAAVFYRCDDIGQRLIGAGWIDGVSDDMPD